MDFLRRNYNSLFPSPIAKVNDTKELVRFGLLGASKIAPQAIISPAKTHPEVLIVGIAARDKKRAEEYARKYGIERVLGGYQELIDDPDIDVIYIPLPNGLHFEWALKALKAGKHVLLEKPSTSNASEAASLFRHEILQQPKSPILLEAFHVLFHPAWQTFLSHLDPKNIASAHSVFFVPKGIIPNTDIRFQYDLAGGTLMDLGTYNSLHLRQVFGTEPEECLEAIPRMMPEGYDQQCDHAMTAKWRFPNGGVGTIECDLSARSAYGLPTMKTPLCRVAHKEFMIEDAGLCHAEGREHSVLKTVTILNPMIPSFWHRIDIVEEHTIRTIKEKKVVRTWTSKEYKKAYTWEKGNGGLNGNESWTTYRHQLEQFVNRVKGREGSGCWMAGEDSVKQMEMLDTAYKKAGLPLRPTNTYH